MCTCMAVHVCTCDLYRVHAHTIMYMHVYMWPWYALTCIGLCTYTSFVVVNLGQYYTIYSCTMYTIYVCTWLTHMHQTLIFFFFFFFKVVGVGRGGLSSACLLWHTYQGTWCNSPSVFSPGFCNGGYISEWIEYLCHNVMCFVIQVII